MHLEIAYMILEISSTLRNNIWNPEFWKFEGPSLGPLKICLEIEENGIFRDQFGPFLPHIFTVSVICGINRWRWKLEKNSKNLENFEGPYWALKNWPGPKKAKFWGSTTCGANTPESYQCIDMLEWTLNNQEMKNYPSALAYFWKINPFFRTNSSDLISKPTTLHVTLYFRGWSCFPIHLNIQSFWLLDSIIGSLKAFKIVKDNFSSGVNQP